MADRAISESGDTARLRRRALRSRDALDALGTEIDDWLGLRSSEPGLGRFVSQLAILGTVLDRMLTRLRQELAALPNELGEGYAHCRRVDRGLATLRRLFVWYAGKYDQRRHDYAPVLLAVDEFARSCWTEGFVVAGRKPPTGPLCFIDNRTDAFANRRCEVPSELRPSVDDPVQEFVDRLPIPVIALPESAVRESWWLVLAAHETGHHVLFDLDLADQVRSALRSAGPPGLLPAWQRWHQELFADLYSVLMVGPAASWAIDELQCGPPSELSCAQGGYPAPLVRLAFLTEVHRALGGDSPASSQLLGSADPAIVPHLDAVPTIVAALLDVPLGRRTLRTLATEAAVRGSSPLPSWSEALVRSNPLLMELATRRAPRVLVAAAVHRYRALVAANMDAMLPALHDGLLATLARSGDKGQLAPSTDLRAATTLGDELGELLVERSAEREPA